MRPVRRWAVGRLLRRDLGEVSQRARQFGMRDPRALEIVDGLGRAFIGGYNRMLSAPDVVRVMRDGDRVAPHYRPFWFEGAAMGYLPRCAWDRGCRPRDAELELLRLRPGFRYLYYVGFGFWYGFRHPRRPERLAELAEWVDPMYYPLCYDGYGFKLGFFDYGSKRRIPETLKRCPEALAGPLHQGFGGSMFFVHHDDEDGWRELCRRLPERHVADVELGRALARGFTGVDRPDALLAFAEAASNDEELGARLTGLTWAMAARQMNDPLYFDRCVAAGQPRSRRLLAAMPEICEMMRLRAEGYDAWQALTREAVVELFRIVAADRGRRGRTGS